MVATYSLADGSQTVLAVQGDAEPPLPSHNGVVVAPMRLSKVQRSC